MDDRKKKESLEVDADLRALRRKRRLRKRKRQQLMRRRLLLICAAAGAVLAAVLLIRHFTGKTKEHTRTSAQTAEAETQTNVPASDVLHLSFPKLLVDTAGTNSTELTREHLTVTEFGQILDQLYRDNYVLVDIHDLAGADNGFTAGEIQIPEGKTPLIISERNINYSEQNTEQGYATGIEITEDGTVVNVFRDTNGAVTRGDYDVMTCVDSFVRAHPDFSCNGAKGLLAVTGFNGVLGYGEVNAEQCRKVVHALQDEGWEFASYTYDAISYGSELALVEEDARQWQKVCAPLLAEPDVILLPGRADIGGRNPYTDANPKFKLLYDQGFRYFCVDDSENLTWLQTTDRFVRQGMHEIDTLRQFQALMQGGVEELRSETERTRKTTGESLVGIGTEDVQDGTSSEEPGEEASSAETDPEQDSDETDSGEEDGGSSDDESGEEDGGSDDDESGEDSSDD